MPNRIIRESCRTSPNLARLSDFAERFFWRLTTLADDFGRFDATAQTLASLCFAVAPVPARRIEHALGELVRETLIVVYQLEERRLGQFTTWATHQTIRAKHSKFPPPTDENICQQMMSDDNKCLRNRNRIRDRNREAGFEIVIGDEPFRQQLQAAYPLVALAAELPKMRAWCAANPAKAQKSNWRRFVQGWCAREQKEREANGTRHTPDPVDDGARRDRAAKLRAVEQPVDV